MGRPPQVPALQRSTSLDSWGESEEPAMVVTQANNLESGRSGHLGGGAAAAEQSAPEFEPSSTRHGEGDNLQVSTASVETIETSDDIRDRMTDIRMMMNVKGRGLGSGSDPNSPDDCCDSQQDATLKQLQKDENSGCSCTIS